MQKGCLLRHRLSRCIDDWLQYTVEYPMANPSLKLAPDHIRDVHMIEKASIMKLIPSLQTSG
jgi:hypothetical protein